MRKLILALTGVLLLLLMAACGKAQQESTPATEPQTVESTEDSAKIQTTETSPAPSALREEDCPKPVVGIWKGRVCHKNDQGLIDQGLIYQIVEIHADDSVTLFSRDFDQRSTNPVGETFTGEWTLLKSLEDEVFEKPVTSYFLQPEPFGLAQTTYVWKFHSQDSRAGLESTGTTLYFVLRLGEQWCMVDVDMPNGTALEENDIFISLMEDYPVLREEDCPKPLGRYQTSVLFYSNNTWEKVTYLDVREDGSVILYYMFDTDMGGIEMKGRWTLWVNQEQEGSYGGPGDAWENWNSTTKYLWRFDSDESYKIPGGETCRIWLLFTFKENGNLWLHHNGMQFQSTYQLTPAE